MAELDLYNCPTGLRSELFNGIRTCIRNEVAPGCTPGCTPVLYSSFNIPHSKICGQIRGYEVEGLYDMNGLRGNSVNDNYLDGTTCNNTPQFLGNDWTCAVTGCVHGNICPSRLWNTSTCGMVSPFFKYLSVSTTKDIVMRV